LRWNSIRVKLLVILTLLIVSGFTFVLLLNDSNNTEDFESLLEQKISADCLRYINSINSYTDIMSANGYSTARTGEFFYNEFKNTEELKEKLNDYLLSQIAQNPTVYGIGIWYEPSLFPEKEYIGPYAYWKGNEVQLTYEFSEHDFTKDQWYTTGLPEDWDRNKRRPSSQYLTSPYDYGDGHIYITLDTIMYDHEGNIIGLTSTDWTLDFLPSLLEEFTITESSTIFFIDPDTSKNLYHSDESKIFTVFDKSLWGDFLPEDPLTDEIQVIADIEIEGSLSTIYYGRTKLGFLLGFAVPHREAFANLIIMRRNNARNVIIILIISLLILYSLLKRMIFTPLQLLKNATLHFGMDNFQTRAPIVNPTDEIGELAMDFNHMAEQLELSFLNLKKTKDNLELKVTERTEYLNDVISSLEAAQEKLIIYERVASTANMIAGLAHQINTPLGIAITASTYLESRIADKEVENIQPDFEKAMELIVSNLKKTASLIQAYKKLSVKQIIEHKREFDLRDMIEIILAGMKSKINKENIEISIVCTENIKVLSYAGIFTQIITNLLSNALSHGRIKLNELIKIDIIMKFEYGQLKIIFSDNGIGIENENLPRIFEPFFSTGKGTGLGLNIIYNLITQKLDGQILCTSTKDTGTTFTIILPGEIVIEKNS